MRRAAGRSAGAGGTGRRSFRAAGRRLRPAQGHGRTARGERPRHGSGAGRRLRRAAADHGEMLRSHRPDGRLRRKRFAPGRQRRRRGRGPVPRGARRRSAERVHQHQGHERPRQRRRHRRPRRKDAGRQPRPRRRNLRNRHELPARLTRLFQKQRQPRRKGENAGQAGQDAKKQGTFFERPLSEAGYLQKSFKSFRREFQKSRCPVLRFAAPLLLRGCFSSPISIRKGM